MIGLMMNPFIQHALDDVITYPTASAKLANPTSTSPSDEKWVLKRFSNGGLIVDDHFRVKMIPKALANKPADAQSKESKIPEATMQDVFALGDVSVFEQGRLPATAQVANRKYPLDLDISNNFLLRSVFSPTPFLSPSISFD